MEKYENEEYLKESIMEQSRHLFVYGYDNEYRSEFLQNLEKDYPVTMDSNKPLAIYISSLEMPKTDVNIKDKDSIIINVMNREYLYFTIAAKLLEKSAEIDKDTLNSRLSKMIYFANKKRNKKYPEIETFDDLLEEMKKSQSFYYENYNKYINGLTNQVPIDDVSIPFLPLEWFVREYKSGMNIDSYIGILFDVKDSLSVPSTQAINNLVNSRINKDISIKVVDKPGNWKTFESTNGQIVQSTHDYGTIELDDSLEKHMDRYMERFEIE